MSPIGPTNVELAEALEQMAELLVRRGETNPYRVQAYLHGAETVRGLAEPVAVRYGRGGREALTELPGIGPNLAGHLAQYVETGRIGLRDRLLTAADPAALFATLPGVGVVLAARLAGELGLTSLADLERAAHDGRLAALPGVGPRTVEAVRMQVNSVLSRSARRRARRVGRQVAVLAAAAHTAPPRPPAPAASAPVPEPTEAPRPTATIYTLFPTSAAA